MAIVSIICPQCSFSKDIPEERIPKGTVKVTCPKCQHQFAYPYGSEKAAQETTPSKTEQLTEETAPSRKEIEQVTNSTELKTQKPPQHSSDETIALPTLQELFNSSWRLFTKRGATLLCLTLLAFIPYLAMEGGASFLQLFFPELRVLLTSFGLLTLLAIVVFSLWSAAAAVCAALDDTLSVRGALRKGWHNLGSFIWLSLVQSFIVIGASCLLIVPGLYLTICFFFAQLVLLHEGEKGLNALLKSKEYIKGHFLPVFCRLVPIWLIPLVLGFIPLAGGILSLLCVPFALIYTRQLYQGLLAIRKEMKFVPHTQYKWLWVGVSGYFIFPILMFMIMPGISPFSPFRALVRERPGGGPPPAMANFVKMHNALSRQAGMAWDANPVSMTAEQYDALLASHKVDFESGTKVTVGPAAFMYGRFSKFDNRPGSIMLISRVAQIPNLDLDSSKSARIVIHHVMDQKRGELCDIAKNGDFQQQFKMLIKQSAPTPSYETMNTINLREGATEKDIAAIEGTLELKLPVRIEIASLDSSKVGKPVTIAGSTVTLKKLASGLVNLDFQGDSGKFLKMVGYDAKGQQIADMGSPGKCQGDKKEITSSFVEDVHSIKVIVASDFIERKYPFVLNQPKGGFP